MGRTDVHAAVSIYAANKAPDILSSTTGKLPETFEIKEQGIKILKRGVYSSVASLILGYRDKTTQHIGEKRVLIKYFGKENDEVKTRHKDPAQSTIDTCNFLSGNGDFPKYYFHEKTDIGTFLVLQQIGDETFAEDALSYRGDSLRYLLQRIFPYISRFQINTTKALGRLVEKDIAQEKFFSIFGRRPSALRILDYLRAVKGKQSIDELDKNLKKAVLDNSIPVRKIYTPRKDSFRVTHGDLISKNIIFKENEKQQYGFIDADPCITSPVLDLSTLLASPGIELRPSDWKALTDLFLCSDGIEEDSMGKRGIDLHLIREGLVSKLENLGVEFANDEPPGNPYFYTFMGIFFRTGRIAAKVKDLQLLHPNIYTTMADDDPLLNNTITEMKNKMSLSLDGVVKDPSTFGISRAEYAGELTKLYEVLGNEGIIDPIEDRCPISREFSRAERPNFQANSPRTVKPAKEHA